MVLEALVSDSRVIPKQLTSCWPRGPMFSHTTSNVPRLARQVRVQASVERSLAILGHAHDRGALTKERAHARPRREP